MTNGPGPHSRLERTQGLARGLVDRVVVQHGQWVALDGIQIQLKQAHQLAEFRLRDSSIASRICRLPL